MLSVSRFKWSFLIILFALIQFVTCETWVILVDTSKYFYNYRHSVNVLALNNEFIKLGIKEENIIILLADYPALNSRNRYPGRMYYHKDRLYSISGPDIHIDSSFVSTSSFIDVLTGRNIKDKRQNGNFNKNNINELYDNNILKSNNESNVILYITGHGGDEFMKFNDIDELGAYELSNIINELYIKMKYKQLLILIDTCQASTLTQYINAPNVISITSSMKNENSYALHSDTTIGISTIDRFTSSTIKFLNYFYNKEYVPSTSSKSLSDNSIQKKSNQKKNSNRNLSLLDLYQWYQPQELHSHATLHISNLSKPINSIKINEFFSPPLEISKTIVKTERVVVEELVNKNKVKDKEVEVEHAIKDDDKLCNSNRENNIISLDDIAVKVQYLSSNQYDYNDFHNYQQEVTMMEKPRFNSIILMTMFTVLVIFVPCFI